MDANTTRYVMLAGSFTGHNAPLFRLTELLSRKKDTDGHELMVSVFGPTSFEDELWPRLTLDQRKRVKFYNYLVAETDSTASPSFTTMEEATLAFCRDTLKCTPCEKLHQGSLLNSSVVFATYLLCQTPLLRRITALQPQAIIGDAGYPWGYLTSRILGLPYISSCSSALETPDQALFYLRDVDYIQASVVLLQRTFDITYDPASCYQNYSDDCTIVWTIPELDPKKEQIRKVQYFGGTSTNNSPTSVTDELVREAQRFEGKTVLVSMGTVVGEVFPMDLNTLFSTISNTIGGRDDVLVILSLGVAYDEFVENMPIPKNVLARRRVNQRQLLGSGAVDLFITHGGNNSVHEGLFGGVPLLVLPVFGDQHHNASMVLSQSLGSAILSPFAPGPSKNLDHVTASAIQIHTDQLLFPSTHNELVRANCRRVQHQMVQQSHWVDEYGASVINDVCRTASARHEQIRG